MAEQFGDEKANVVINYRSERHLEVVSQTIRLIEDAGGKAIKVQADISEEDDVERLIQSAVDQFGTLDILINNA